MMFMYKNRHEEDLVRTSIVNAVFEQIDQLIEKTAQNGTVLFDIRPSNIVLNRTELINGQIIPHVRFIDVDDEYCEDFESTKTELVICSQFVMCVLFKQFMKHKFMYQAKWGMKTNALLRVYKYYKVLEETTDS